MTRQNVLTRLIGLPKEERQQAQAVKKENTSGDAAADPRTVLVSHVGNGSGGSQPSTDQGSWPQVCFCLQVCLNGRLLRLALQMVVAVMA